ncbi:MAG: tetratricopeptide (TPR) repeat protein, partial [Pseudohongiellaceae bacterium]
MKNNLITATALQLSFVFFALTLSGCGSEENTAATIMGHLERSKAYAKQGQYRAAAIEAKNVIKKDRANLTGYEQLATIFYILGNYKNAISTLETAKEKLNTSSHLLLAKSYARIGKLSSAETALKHYKNASSDTSSDDVKIIDAKILASRQQDDQAITLLRDLVSKNANNTEAYNLISQLYIKRNMLEQANANINETLTKNPNNPEALYLSAHIAYQTNNLQKAEDQLTNALLELPETDIILPLRTLTLSQLSKVLTEQGRSSEALIYTKLLAEANPKSSEAQSQFEKALTLLKEGKTDEAELHLTELNKNYPSSEASAIYLGFINFQKGEYAQADKLFSQNFDSEIASTKLIQAMVATKIQLKKTNEALDILEQALTTRPKSKELLTIYGLTALNSDTRQSKGINTLEKLIAADPTHIQLQLSLIRYHLQNDKEELAIAKLERLTKESPENINVAVLYSAALLEQEKPKLANKVIDRLLSARNRDAEALVLAAKYSLKNKNLTKAGKYYKAALKKSPANIDALTGLGTIALYQQDSVNAKQYFEQIITAQPSNPLAYRSLISALEMQKQGDKTIATLTTYIKQYKQNTSIPLYVLAEYYSLKNNTQKAAELLTQDTITTTKTAYQRQIISRINHQQYQLAANIKDWSTARIHLMKTIEYTPNSEQLTGELINLETNDDNITEADRLITLAKQQFPSSAMPALAKANIWVKNNELGTAKILLENEWNEKEDPRIMSARIGLEKGNATAKATLIKEWKR